MGLSWEFRSHGPIPTQAGPSFPALIPRMTLSSTYPDEKLLDLIPKYIMLDNDRGSDITMGLCIHIMITL
jgi:hypothetical protein